MLPVTKWWQFGLFGGVVLSIVTAIKAIAALIVGTFGQTEWVLADTGGFAAAIFGMGFLSGLIVWAGRGLYTHIGIVGDAIIGLAVMEVFFLSCMFIFRPEMLGSKFTNVGLPMLIIAAVTGPICGVWFGRDFRKEFTIPKEEFKRTPRQNEAENSSFEL